MIAKLTNRQIEALAVLEHDADFKEIMDWIRASHRASVDACVTESDELTLRRAQGAAVDLAEIIELADSARTRLERLRK